MSILPTCMHVRCMHTLYRWLRAAMGVRNPGPLQEPVPPPVYSHLLVCVGAHTCGDQRITSGVHSPTIWVPGFKLRSGLAASTFNSLAVLPHLLSRPASPPEPPCLHS